MQKPCSLFRLEMLRDTTELRELTNLRSSFAGQISLFLRRKCWIKKQRSFTMLYLRRRGKPSKIGKQQRKKH